LKSGNERHPGISYHKLPVGGGLAGFLVIIASWVAFLGKAQVPLIRYFFGLSVLLGLVVGLFLRFRHRDKPINTYSFLGPEQRRK
jgi:hypothetical protein